MGEIRNLHRLHPKSMFVFDANTILALLRFLRRDDQVPLSYNALLRESRARVHLQWQKRERFLPVNPVLGIMELTKQDLMPDYSAYSEYFNDFFGTLFRVNNYDPRWVRMAYEPALRMLETTHYSVGMTIQQILLLAPSTGGLERKQILQNVDTFLSWVISRHEELTMIGGPLLHLAVYAIAGEPTAHRFLKLARVDREGLQNVARNVAWDIMHWINLEMNYHYKKYENTVVCTADQALAEFLLQRRNLGPRIGSSALVTSTVVESYGALNIPDLSKIEGTRLGEEIAQRLVAFWQHLATVSKGNIWFGPPPDKYDQMINRV